MCGVVQPPSTSVAGVIRRVVVGEGDDLTDLGADRGRGLNAKSLIETATAPASLVSLHTAPPGARTRGGAWRGLLAAVLAGGRRPCSTHRQRARTGTRWPDRRSFRLGMVCPPILGAGLRPQGTPRLSRQSPWHRAPTRYRGRVLERSDRSRARAPPDIDPGTMRRMLLHEGPGGTRRRAATCATWAMRSCSTTRSSTSRFWNRIEAVRWPEDPTAFDRRLAESLVLFASIGRQPHVWAGPDP